MDRNLVYPGSIPLDTDLLTINRNTMIALGYLAQAVVGASTVVDGLACTPTSPASLTVNVGPGSITSLETIDAQAYGSLPADPTDVLVKTGINISAQSFTLSAPTISGQATNFLIQAVLGESDTDPVVLPYYNAANPAQPYSGPNGSGLAQNTTRVQFVQLQLKAGTPAPVGTQITPPVDNGWIGLYVITVNYGQSAISATNIVTLPTAPFIPFKLPSLRPGFGSGVQTFTTSGSFVVPAGVSQAEVEVWGGGSGSYASVANIPSGGGCGGGYARKLVQGLTPGQVIPITIGGGGAAGTVSGALPSSGGSSSFGTFVSAKGGQLNGLASAANPQSGATPAGIGVGGDINLTGSAGQSGVANLGGLGGSAPMGGTQNSGTSALAGVFPGGGASGAGTGATGNSAYNGAPGASGFVIVRW
jgi:hypothetical protein